MATRLLSLILAFLFLGMPSVVSTTLVHNSSLLKVQCAVSTSAWEARSPKAAWMLSLRSADGTVIEEVLVMAQRNPQQLSLGLRNSGVYILATYFDANGNSAMDRGLWQPHRTLRLQQQRSQPLQRARPDRPALRPPGAAAETGPKSGLLGL